MGATSKNVKIWKIENEFSATYWSSEFILYTLHGSQKVSFKVRLCRLLDNNVHWHKKAIVLCGCVFDNLMNYIMVMILVQAVCDLSMLDRRKNSNPNRIRLLTKPVVTWEYQDYAILQPGVFFSTHSVTNWTSTTSDGRCGSDWTYTLGRTKFPS